MDLMPFARIVAVFALVLHVVTDLSFLAVKFNISWEKLLGDFVDKRGNFPCSVSQFFFAVVFVRDNRHSNIMLALLKNKEVKN